MFSYRKLLITTEFCLDNIVYFPQPPAERPSLPPDLPLLPVVYTDFCPPLPPPANDRCRSRRDIRRRRYAMLGLAFWAVLYLVCFGLGVAVLVWLLV